MTSVPAAATRRRSAAKYCCGRRSSRFGRGRTARSYVRGRNTPFGEWWARRCLSSFVGMQALRDSDSITDRQRVVIRLIAEGLSNGEVADELGISARTAKAHCDALRLKLGVPRRRQIPLAYRLLTGEDPLAQSLELAKADDGG